MPTTKLAALTACLVPLCCHVLAAQEEPSLDAAALMVVEGLAKDDMLNVRATASATGMVIGRLPNGSTLRNLGCDEVNGYKWCNIAALDDEKLHGWTPARYLHAVAGEAGAQQAAQAAKPADAQAESAELLPSEDPAAPAPLNRKQNAAVPEAPSAPTVDAPTLIAAAEAADSGSPAGEVEAEPTSGPSAPAEPAGLSARMGDSAAGRLAYGGQGDAASVVESDAVVSAFRTAYALASTPPAGELHRLGSGDDEPPAATGKPAAAAQPAVPAPRSVTTVPRGTAVGARVAQLQAGAAAPAYDTVGEIPCARYIGQPMTRCEAAIARTGAEAAEVTVTLPDGGKRIIRFQDGKPEGSNSRGEFRFTREGDLNMIRVGTSERFEILDSLAFGE